MVAILAPVRQVTYEAFLFDARVEKWYECLTCNPMRRVGHALALFDGKVYAWGGRSGPLPLLKVLPQEIFTFELE